MSLFEKIKNNRKLRRVFTSLSAVFLVNLAILSAFFLLNGKESISTENANALYGGETNLRGYPFSGYINDFSSVFSRQVCGLSYLSSTSGISAAHCFDDKGLYYAGNGTYESNPENSVAIKNYVLHKEWNPKTLSGDIAFLILENPVENIDTYTQIASPAGGCNYEILAYGSTDIDVLSNYDLRRSSTVCIETITENTFYFKSPDAGVCFGDSGSPIYLKGTNKIVGIVSAITSDKASYSKDNCFINNRAVATRADLALEMFSTESETDKECPSGSGNICKDSEVCRSNKCMDSEDFVYISTFDNRSEDYIFSSASSIIIKIVAVVVIVGSLIFLFIKISKTN